MATVMNVISTKDVEARMLAIRGQYVLIDRDVAALYGVETKRVNEAVRNNPDKFPEGYAFHLQVSETEELVENFDRFEPIKHSLQTTAFTERGLYMLATILKSPQAARTTLAIIETFVQARQLARTMENLQAVADGGPQQKTLLEKSGKILAEIIGNNLSTESVETEIELNFAVIKIRHKHIKK